MWVEKLPSGNFRFTERYKDYYSGKTKRVSVTLERNTTQSRKMAEHLLQEKIDAVVPAEIRGLNLSDLIEKYLLYKEKAVKQSTWRRDKFTCETIKNILGEDILVDKINAKYVTSKFMESEKEPGTLNELLLRFKALIRWAYKNDYIEDIRFLDKIDNFKDMTKREKVNDKVLEASELNKLSAAMSILRWKYLTEFLALSGLRFGEAAALTKKDVDLKERLIHITKNYDMNNDVTTTPKTLCSIRDVYIQDDLYAVCRCINELRAQLQLTGELTRGDLFLPGCKKEHVEYDSFRQYLHDKSMQVIGRPITPHALRHTHASLLMEQGVAVDVISRRLGHENSKVTKEIYLHVTEKLKEKDYQQIAAVSILK